MTKRAKAIKELETEIEKLLADDPIKLAQWRTIKAEVGRRKERYAAEVWQELIAKQESKDG